MKDQLIEKVRVFREAFDFSQSADDPIHYRLTLEETDELIDAFIEPEPLMRRVAVADALADRVFTSCGGIIDGCDMHHYLDKTIKWAERFDMDLPRAVDAVFTSNMSKLCTSDQVEPTRAKYSSIGVIVHFEAVGDNFRCICSHAVTGDDGKEYPAGKLLKSVGYQEPDFSYLEV